VAALAATSRIFRTYKSEPLPQSPSVLGRLELAEPLNHLQRQQAHLVLQGHRSLALQVVLAGPQPSGHTSRSTVAAEEAVAQSATQPLLQGPRSQARWPSFQAPSSPLETEVLEDLLERLAVQAVLRHFLQSLMPQLLPLAAVAGLEA
jgi:hypothetical protein